MLDQKTSGELELIYVKMICGEIDVSNIIYEYPDKQKELISEFIDWSQKSKKILEILKGKIQSEFFTRGVGFSERVNQNQKIEYKDFYRQRLIEEIRDIKINNIIE